jgi:hypothetical protein
VPVNPALLQHAQEPEELGEPGGRPDHPVRRVDEVRHLDVVWFGSWIIFRVEHYPFGLLTMTVSLEAIFLSTL